MYAGKVVRLVVAQENGGIEGPCVGPATAQNLPLVANRLDTKKMKDKGKGVLFFLPVGELHIQRSISLVTNHVVQGLPRTFRVRQGQVTPGELKK